ncbi:hypothetical protein [Nocardioides stalactiti]|uniref:hypothetical protein n=1 Tax=Nocardioides stalactiti TaxID=2755356 RepID=UPI0016003D4E|nr:hypothetical protein [Nocardioides stalactiti]
MKKVGRTLTTVAVTTGLALAVTGCSDNVIGADGPRPGVAAQVEDVEISLDDLTSVTDGLCTLQAADSQAAPTSREFAQAQILQAWVGALVTAEFAADNDLEVSAPDAGLELAAGWDDVDEDDQDPLRAYVDAFVYSSAVEQELAGESAPDPADYDIAINPRFDIELGDVTLTQSQLSVPVSDEAASDAEAPSPEVVAALPDDQVCGKKADPAVQPPIPMG